MSEVNLLRSLPHVSRDVKKRDEEKNPEIIAEACAYGRMYFDGPREYGYGGYNYDGRWISVAKDIVSHFGLKSGMRVLDVGAAKGFLVRDLMEVCPGLDVYGVDISEYAMMNCHADAIGRLHQGSADKLLFPDDSFDCVLSVNTIHNLDRGGVKRALMEMERVAKGAGRTFVQVDSYNTPEQKEIFESWVLTALFHDYPEEWIKVFNEACYTGDWYWTIME